MKTHTIIFNIVHTSLKEAIGDNLLVKIDEYNGNYTETHLYTKEREIWFSCDYRELTIGYGPNHIHYNSDYSDMNDAIDKVICLLTKKIKNTLYYKGDTCYKIQTEFELDDKSLIDFGASTSLWFSFWKRTTTKVKYEDALIDSNDIESKLEKIKQNLRPPSTP